MGIIDYLNWFSTLKSKEVSLTESNSNWSKKVNINKDQNGLRTDIPFLDSKILYKKNTSFYFLDDNIKIRIKHFKILNSEISINRIFQSYIFETTCFNESKERFFKYFSKIESPFFLANFIKNGKNDLNYELNSIIFKITISELAENFKGFFLCIEIDKKMSFEEFKHCVNSIILSIGFFSGFLYKKEEYFFQSDDCDFLDVDLLYRSQNKRFFIYEPFTMLSQAYVDDEESKFSSSVSEKQFSKLVDLIYNNPKYYSSIQMLFGNNKDSFIVEHSVLMVVLETIAKEIRSKFHAEHIEKVSIKEEAYVALKSIENNVSKESFEVLKEALENIDVSKAKNIIDFELAFSALKIKLDENDRKSLKRRNNIFHGRLLNDFEKINSEESYSELEVDYKFHSYKLYILIYKLILKQVEFEGYLLNHQKILSESSKLNENDPYFIKL